MNDNWYVRNTAGKTFGPITFETLKQWVRDGRVEPLAGLSQDLENWMLAPLKPELEMNWIVENNPGQFYGPTHRAVVDDLVAGGSLSAGARFYQDDRGAAAQAAAALASAQTELAARETSLAAAQAELAARETARAQQAAAAEKLRAEAAALRETLKAKDDLLAAKDASLVAKDAALQAKDAALAAKADELAAKNAALAAKTAELARKEEVHEREWRTEVLVPEVVVSDEPPPPVARTVFGAKPGAAPSNAAPRPQPGANSLADLERRAQEELARMGGLKGAGRFFFKGK